MPRIHQVSYEKHRYQWRLHHIQTCRGGQLPMLSRPTRTEDGPVDWGARFPAGALPSQEIERGSCLLGLPNILLPCHYSGSKHHLLGTCLQVDRKGLRFRIAISATVCFFIQYYCWHHVLHLLKLDRIEGFPIPMIHVCIG